MKVSIIVPVYNSSNHLRDCLDSLINQSLDEIEIIVVDDASKDGCGKICDGYAKKDKRIQVVHMPLNGGLSAARNEVQNGIRQLDCLPSSAYKNSLIELLSLTVERDS